MHPPSVGRHTQISPTGRLRSRPIRPRSRQEPRDFSSGTERPRVDLSLCSAPGPWNLPSRRSLRLSRRRHCPPVVESADASLNGDAPCPSVHTWLSVGRPHRKEKRRHKYRGATHQCNNHDAVSCSDLSVQNKPITATPKTVVSAALLPMVEDNTALVVAEIFPRAKQHRSPLRGRIIIQNPTLVSDQRQRVH
jgi:hypothetical protein